MYAGSQLALTTVLLTGSTGVTLASSGVVILSCPASLRRAVGCSRPENLGRIVGCKREPMTRLDTKSGVGVMRNGLADERRAREGLVKVKVERR